MNSYGLNLIAMICGVVVILYANDFGTFTPFIGIMGFGFFIYGAWGMIIESGRRGHFMNIRR